MKHFVHVLILLALFVFTSCNEEIESNSNYNTNSNNQIQKQIGEASDDSDDLSQFIKLSFVPEDVIWKQFETNNGKKIIAVIRFTPEESALIIAQSQAGEKTEISAERWFPQELIAQSDISGDQVLHGTIYLTNSFYKDPFNKGRVVKLDNSAYFILELTTF